MYRKTYLIADKKDFENMVTYSKAILQDIELKKNEEGMELLVYIKYEFIGGPEVMNFLKEFRFDIPTNEKITKIDTYPGVPDKFRLYALTKNDETIMINESISKEIKETVENYLNKKVTLCYRTPPGE